MGERRAHLHLAARPLPRYIMMGATERGRAPTRNDLSAASLYSIAWMLTGFVFAINLFVGVVVENFSRIQKEEDGSASMTLEQQQWVATMQTATKMLPAKVTRPPSTRRQRSSLPRRPYRRATTGIYTEK